MEAPEDRHHLEQRAVGQGHGIHVVGRIQCGKTLPQMYDSGIHLCMNMQWP